MSAVVLPPHGRWAWDARGGGRAIRVSTHTDSGLLNLSLWREDICVGTARLRPDEAATLVTGITEGLAELAGRPRVAVLLGGLAAWPGAVETGAAELTPVKSQFEPNVQAVPTAEELAARLEDPTLTILDVRGDDEWSGRGGYPCDPRRGHIPGARHVEVGSFFAGPGTPSAPDEIGALVGLPPGAEVVAYCHSGSRSALATLALRSAGYRARNYPGSWHEWSRRSELPVSRD